MWERDGGVPDGGEVQAGRGGRVSGRADDSTLEESALDATMLSPRVLNAIERIWGPEARKRHLLEPNAFARLKQIRGVGPSSIGEVERALLAWGLGGLAGRSEALDPHAKRRLVHRNRLHRALDYLGAVELLRMLAEICAERRAWYWKRSSVGRRRDLYRSKLERRLLYYSRCEEVFTRSAGDAPAHEDP